MRRFSNRQQAIEYLQDILPEGDHYFGTAKVSVGKKKHFVIMLPIPKEQYDAA
jgi:hypothetical protein